jgi:REP element-mobilizing transposase RayT
MTRARREVVSLDDTPYYHCISRCVRRAFLCGVDSYAGKDYSHRRDWVRNRLIELTKVFAVDVCAYAILSNHYHLVLRIDRDRAQSWSDEAVIRRWTRLFQVPEVVKLAQRQDSPQAVREASRNWIETARTRLHDVSWFMRCLNEHLARRANAEDGCKGRFWEGRFKSQALLDEAGLLTCMAYVDLNPIRAGMAESPEASDFTSIQQRIREITGRPIDAAVPLRALAPDRRSALPFSLKDYLLLVDWTGRAIRDNKRGAIPEQLPPILTRLNIEPGHWLRHMGKRRHRFYHAVGRVQALRNLAERAGRHWLQGMTSSERLFRQSIA